MRHLSREEYDKVTKEFAQLTTLSAQKKYIKQNGLDIKFDEENSEKEEKENGLQQGSK